MKKYLSLLLTAVMVFVLIPFSILPASADVYSGSCGAQGDNLTWSLNTETGVLEISGDGGMKDFGSSPWVALRDFIKSISFSGNITSIGNRAFEQLYGLTNITIPSTVTIIGFRVFDCCTGLTSVTIPASAKSIDTNPLSGCSGLESITVESGNKKYHSSGNCLIETESNILVAGCKNSVIPSDGSVTSIGDFAFYNCDGLASITIPSSVTSIGDYVFSDCTGLEKINVESGNAVYSSAGNCLIKTESKTLILGCKNSAIPNDGSVTSIDRFAFENCLGLKSVIVPSSVTDIHDTAFDGCTGLESITVNSGNTVYSSAGNCLIATKSKTLILGCKKSIIPSNGSVTSIGKYAFEDCFGLISIVIPSSVTSIGDYAFWNCTGLKSVTIQQGVVSIGMNAFNHCTELTSITLPSSVTSVERGAFGSCTGLKFITVESGNIVYSSAGNCLVEIGPKTLVLGCENSVIPNDGSVTSIEDFAFRDCIGLTSIFIPLSVTSVGEWVFEGCSSLTDVYCEAKSQPSGWDFFWNIGCDANVHWGSSAPTEIITGDISGDGKVNSKDYALLKRYCLGTYKLDDSVKSAGDINKDGKVNSKDYALLKRACLGTYTIEQ